jgi:hypothetical protein
VDNSPIKIFGGKETQGGKEQSNSNGPPFLDVAFVGWLVWECLFCVVPRNSRTITDSCWLGFLLGRFWCPCFLLRLLLSETETNNESLLPLLTFSILSHTLIQSMRKKSVQEEILATEQQSDRDERVTVSRMRFEVYGESERTRETRPTNSANKALTVRFLLTVTLTTEQTPEQQLGPNVLTVTAMVHPNTTWSSSTSMLHLQFVQLLLTVTLLWPRPVLLLRVM